MAAPLLSRHIAKHLQTTHTIDKAVDILRHAFPGNELNISKSHIAIPLPHRDRPTYLLANHNPQPWELFPMKAAAYQQYPNIFNNSCKFMASLNRDLLLMLPVSVNRPSKIGLDLARVLRNLGIIHSFEWQQKRGRCKHGDFLWPKGREPDSWIETGLYQHTFIRLNLRWDKHRPLWQPPAADAHIPSASQLSSHLPLSVKNVSKASQPVLLQPEQIVERRSLMTSGIYLMYHHKLGLITDAQAEMYDVPALALVHLGLPHSMVAQIHGALRDKFIAEGGAGLEPVKTGQYVPLTEWSMVDWVKNTLTQRQQQLDADAAEQQASQLQSSVEDGNKKMLARVEELTGRADQFHDELVAWEIREGRVLDLVPEVVRKNIEAITNKVRQDRGRTGQDRGRTLGSGSSPPRDSFAMSRDQAGSGGSFDAQPRPRSTFGLYGRDGDGDQSQFMPNRGDRMGGRGGWERRDAGPGQAEESRGGRGRGRDDGGAMGRGRQGY